MGAGAARRNRRGRDRRREAGQLLERLAASGVVPYHGDAESSEAHYRPALEFAEQRRMGPLVAHCHLGLGKLRGRTGKQDQAREHLTTATTTYREMDMRFWLEQAEAELRGA